MHDRIGDERSDMDPGILAAAETLHMLATGSTDRMDDEAVRLEDYLQRRLDGWNKHTSITALHGVYDELVRSLATVALAEWKQCPWNPKNEPRSK